MSYYQEAERLRNNQIQVWKDNNVLFAVTRHFKYGEEREVENIEFKSKKALNEYYKEIKDWLKAGKDCSDKWTITVEFSDGRELSGKIDC